MTRCADDFTDLELFSSIVELETGQQTNDDRGNYWSLGTPQKSSQTMFFYCTFITPSSILRSQMAKNKHATQLNGHPRP